MVGLTCLGVLSEFCGLWFCFVFCLFELEFGGFVYFAV